MARQYYVTRHYYVMNMECANCGKILTGALSMPDGVRKVSAKLSRKKLTVEADFVKVSDDDII
jgi:copper chaperone CopZ